VTIIVLQTGDPVASVSQTGRQFADFIRDSAGDAWSGAWQVHDLRVNDALPPLDGASAFVITGSPSSVTERAAWMLRAEEYVRAIVAAEVPLLGICFGHQLIGQALDGHVAKNPRGRELGTVAVERGAATDGEALFLGLPRVFDANASHVDSVVRLPRDARILASSALEPNAAFAVGDHAWGVQFHPEFDADIVRGYVRARADRMREEGLDPEAALSRATDALHGREVLRNFVRACVLDTKRAAKRSAAAP
jgi:GMP synthase (glutamine-hydrolysing)